MSRRLRRLVAPPLLVCVAVIGVGVANAAAQGETTPCDLLTRSEIKSVFKGKTAEGLRNGPTCTWEIKGGSAKAKGADLELAAAGAASVDYEADDGEVVTGLGDEAYFDAGSDLLGVTEGDTTLLLTYLSRRPVSDEKIQTRLEQVAEYALERCRALAPNYPCGLTDIAE